MNTDNIDRLALADVCWIWPALTLIINATEEQADAALKEYTERFGRNEGVEAIFQIGSIFRKEKRGE